MQVLEGYSYLGNTAGLGEEVNNCFVSIITSSALKVVRGVVLTRSGLEDKARSTTILQELVKWLPANLYRQCLARVGPHHLDPIQLSNLSCYCFLPQGKDSLIGPKISSVRRQADSCFQMSCIIEDDVSKTH